MTAEPPTQLIDQGELRVLVEASRDDSQLAHTIRRPPRWNGPPAVGKPSALRGMVWLLGGAWIARELVHFFL